MNKVSHITKILSAIVHKVGVAVVLPLVIAFVYLPDATGSTPEKREGIPPRRISGGTRVMPVQLSEAVDLFKMNP